MVETAVDSAVECTLSAHMHVWGRMHSVAGVCSYLFMSFVSLVCSCKVLPRGASPFHDWRGCCSMLVKIGLWASAPFTFNLYLI